eukprot:4682407-Prorocentrum_lima.AAC.1
MTCTVCVEEKLMPGKGITIEATTFFEEVRKRWLSPFRLRVQTTPVTTTGLASAPDFKEQRRMQYQPLRAR